MATARQNSQYACVPIHVDLRTERAEIVRDLSDPNGGRFDAAGDFDRVLPRAEGLLRYVDPYGDTIYNTIQATDLLADVRELADGTDLTVVERRGLERLRVMVERCRDGVHLYVWFIGDQAPN